MTRPPYPEPEWLPVARRLRGDDRATLFSDEEVAEARRITALEAPKWETVYGWTEPTEHGGVQVFLTGLSHVDPDLPATQRLGCSFIYDPETPHGRYAYPRFMRTAVRLLERSGCA